jgi:hypothetical protein
MPEMFEALMFAAQREIVITTPYYVPDESLLNALCTTAYRGVDTTIVFPARNDSWIVGAASRSYYAGLLAAGVKIYEYEGGLLHTKSLTVDGEVILIGSPNMDRRSFELNYENNILFEDPGLTCAMRERQQDHIARSHPVTKGTVVAWPMSPSSAPSGPCFDVSWDPVRVERPRNHRPPSRLSVIQRPAGTPAQNACSRKAIAAGLAWLRVKDQDYPVDHDRGITPWWSQSLCVVGQRSGERLECVEPAVPDRHEGDGDGYWPVQDRGFAPLLSER